MANRLTPIDGGKLEDLIGLCLSGGGYRAMLFHAGAIFRLNQLGLLGKIDRVSSVSGGAMAAVALALAYPRFKFDAAGRVSNLTETFLRPVLRQAEDSIDISSSFAGLNPFASAADEAARSYDRNLTNGARLSALPARPVFVFNATSLMTGSVMRFRREYIADYQIGELERLDLRLADVVAACAAFPPFLSPASIDISAGVVRPGTEGPLARPPFTQVAVLTDGGVYDNLGTEAVWKRCRTIFISDAGKPFEEQEEPKQNWLQQSLRVVDIAMDQSQDLRERILVHAYEIGARRGAMWSLGTGRNRPHDPASLLSAQEIEDARSVSTRLWQVPKQTIALLLKAGYAHAAARIRAKFGPDAGGPVDVADADWPTP